MDIVSAISDGSIQLVRPEMDFKFELDTKFKKVPICIYLPTAFLYLPNLGAK